MTELHSYFIYPVDLGLCLDLSSRSASLRLYLFSRTCLFHAFSHCFSTSLPFLTWPGFLALVLRVVNAFPDTFSSVVSSCRSS